MKYMADLSTEIVFKWLKIEESMIIKSDGKVGKYPSREFLNAVVLNNHFDTDGLMSAWALLEPEKALKYEVRTKPSVHLLRARSHATTVTA